MGVSSEPAPADIIGLYSVPIGSSGAARYAEMVSHGVAELQRLLARYAAIDKVLPPWLPFGMEGHSDMEWEAAVRPLTPSRRTLSDSF